VHYHLRGKAPSHVLEAAGFTKCRSGLDIKILEKAGLPLFGLFGLSYGFQSKSRSDEIVEGAGLFVEQTYGPAWALAIIWDHWGDPPFNAVDEAAILLTELKDDDNARYAALAMIVLGRSGPQYSGDTILYIARLALDAGATTKEPVC
jgi:hypothetical protein